MRRKSGPQASTPEKLVRDIRSKTCRRWSAEAQIRIVLEGLRGEYSIAELCRREGRPQHAGCGRTALRGGSSLAYSAAPAICSTGRGIFGP
jgi:transposase-like protein